MSRQYGQREKEEITKESLGEFLPHLGTGLRRWECGSGGDLERRLNQLQKDQRFLSTQSHNLLFSNCICRYLCPNPFFIPIFISFFVFPLGSQNPSSLNGHKSCICHFETLSALRQAVSGLTLHQQRQIQSQMLSPPLQSRDWSWYLNYIVYIPSDLI